MIDMEQRKKTKKVSRPTAAPREFGSVDLYKVSKGKRIDVSNEIKQDIDRGYFDNFPKVKAPLKDIGNRMYLSTKIINADKSVLSKQEVNFLKEQGYNF